MRITTAQTQALATFVSRLRDDWDHPGIVAAITKAAPIATPADIGTALCRLAGNLELRTPATLASPGPHWRDTETGKRSLPDLCPEHRAQKAGACPECIARAVPADRAAELGLWQRPKLTRPARTRRAPQPSTPDLGDVRARADRESTP